jgi:hypothetical protein
VVDASTNGTSVPIDTTRLNRSPRPFCVSASPAATTFLEAGLKAGFIHGSILHIREVAVKRIDNVASRQYVQNQEAGLKAGVSNPGEL